MAIGNSCAICRSNFDPAERYIEGHQSQKIWHVFDACCLRQWLKFSSHCPTCRDPLNGHQIIQIPNPYFSWKKKGWHGIAQLIALGKKNFSSALFVGAGAFFTYKALHTIYGFTLDCIAGFATGSQAIALFGLVGAVPLICNKRSFQVRSQDKRLTQLFAIALGAAVVLISSTSIEELGQVVGISAGATLSATLISFSAEKIPPFSRLITFRQMTHLTAMVVTIATIGKFAWSNTQNWGVLVQTIAMVAAGILGSPFALIAQTLSSIMISAIF